MVLQDNGVNPLATDANVATADDDDTFYRGSAASYNPDLYQGAGHYPL